MPEGVQAYPRWEGPMRTGTTAFVVAAQELRRAMNNMWIWVVIGLFAVFQLFFTRQEEHTLANYVTFVNDLRWVALAIAAIMAGPAFLEDQRRGALELYLARAVTKRDYLWGKTTAVFSATALLMWFPALATYLVSFITFDTHPDQWNQAPWGALLYSILWGALVASLGLGLSCVARSSRGATLILLGGFALLDIFLARVLSNITKNPDLAILSPFAAMKQQTSWIFNIAEPYQFPAWWGILEWLGLLVVGIVLVGWKHPRVRGEEPVRA